MALPTTATLAYSTPLGGVVSDTTKQSLMSAVVLYQPLTLPNNFDPVIFGLYDSFIETDVTAPAGGNMVRTITLTLGPGFFSLFPTSADWAHAFDGLFGATLALALGLSLGKDLISEPVVFS